MSYQLSTADLDPILTAIEERLEEAKPRPLQVISSRLLLVATFGLVLTYLLYLTTGSALIGLAWIWVGLQVLFALLSWRYLPVVKRQRRLYRDLDLVSPDPTPGLVWKSRTPSQQALVRTAVGIALVGIVGGIVLNRGNLEVAELPPLIGMLGLIGGSAYYLWGDRKVPLETAETLLGWIKFGLLIWLAVLLFLIWQGLHWEDWLGTLLAVLWPAWLLVKSRQVARIQERFAPLGRAGSLRETLARRRQEASELGSDAVSLGPDDVANLGYAESEMIRQDRIDAISSSVEEAERWGVFAAELVRGQLRELESRERLAVQDAISALSAGAAVESLAATGQEPVRTLEVAGTAYALRYRLEPESKHVNVLELVSVERGTDG